MDIWVENGWPTKVEKIISKSDNLFDAEFKPLTNLDSEAIIVDGTIPAGLTTDDLYYTESDEYKAVSNHYYAAGKNLAGPDLTGKEYLGDGVYRFYDNIGVTVDYNVFDGVWTYNGTATGNAFFDFTEYFVHKQMAYTYHYVSGSVSNPESQNFNYYTQDGVDTLGIRLSRYDVQTSSITRYDIRNLYLRIQKNQVYNNHKFKLQIEEGTMATTYEPYIMPKKIVNLSDLIADDIIPAGLENNTYLNMIVNQKYIDYLQSLPIK